MTTRTLGRLVAAAALAGVLALPGPAAGADPTPTALPADAEAWQAHLAYMQAMGPNFGAHVADCIEMHGSMAGLLGPNGMMAGMTGGSAQP